MKLEIPKLLRLDCIGDYASHNGLTDLIEFQGALWCCFREASSHYGEDNGSIRILKSKDKKIWEPISLLSKEHVDLRDPHFSITPSKQLMLTLGGSVYKNKKHQGCCPQVTFSSDGTTWSSIQFLALPEEWIWRITWHKEVGYGFSYRLTSPKDKEKPWILTLFKTEDGLHYQPLKTFDHLIYPSEATIRFLENGTMIALLRTRAHALIGVSKPSYKNWEWNDAGYCLGGPNFLILPNEKMIAAGRDYKVNADDSKGYTEGYTAIGFLTKTAYKPLLYLPSSGDNSYPGMVYEDHKLFMSYYSSHEGKTNVYFAEIEIP